MKTIILIISLAGLAADCFGIGATNLLTYQAVNGTNSGATYDPNNGVSISPLALKPQSFIIQHGGISSTNALVVQVQLSFDRTNFQTFATYRPTVTNAGLYVFSPLLATNHFYIRAQVITTNSTTVGVTAASP